MAERLEVRGAVQAIRDAMHRINEALEQLGHTDDVVTLWSRGGGFFTSPIKRESLGRAAGAMRAVDLALTEVRKELRDVGIEDTDSLVAGAAPGVSRRDRWLDLLLLDGTPCGRSGRRASARRPRPGAHPGPVHAEPPRPRPVRTDRRRGGIELGSLVTGP